MTIRNLLAVAVLLLTALSTQAQTVYAGEQTIDKQVYKGLFLTLPLGYRQVEKEWEEHIKPFGRITSSRGAYRITTADMKDISSEPVNFTSLIKGDNKSATLFTAYDLGGGNYVSAGNGNYEAGEKLLKDFADKTLFKNEVRIAEEGFGEAQRNHQKIVKKGESLARDVENNKKEKEKLQRRIEENAKELEQLQKDIETNKTDQTTAQTDMDNRRKNVETVRAKKQ